MAGEDNEQSQLGFGNVVRLGFVSLFTDISTEMILGVLPFFIVTELGASAAILGLIEGTAEAVNYIFRVIAGVFTDKIGRRKPFVLIGYGLSSIAKPFFALTGSWPQAFAVRVVDRAGKGTRTSPRDALISDSVAKSEAGKGFGLHRSLDQTGAVLGPLFAFVAIPFIGIRGLFWVSFIPAVIAVVVLIFFVKDIHAEPRQGTAFQNVRTVLTRDFVFFLVVLGIFSVGAYDYSFILLKAGSLGVKDPTILALVYTVLNVATVLIGLPIGLLADRIGKIPVLFLSFGMFLITSAAGVIIGGNASYAFLIALLFGTYLAISDTVQRAMIPDFTSPELKGTAYAVYYTMIGVCAFAANAIFGWLWTVLGAAAAFQYSVSTSAIGIAALAILVIMRRT